MILATIIVVAVLLVLLMLGLCKAAAKDAPSPRGCNGKKVHSL